MNHKQKIIVLWVNPNIYRFLLYVFDIQPFPALTSCFSITCGFPTIELSSSIQQYCQSGFHLYSLSQLSSYRLSSFSPFCCWRPTFGLPLLLRRSCPFAGWLLVLNLRRNSQIIRCFSWILLVRTWITFSLQFFNSFELCYDIGYLLWF